MLPFIDLFFGIVDIFLIYSLYNQILDGSFWFLCCEYLFAYSIKWVVLVVATGVKAQRAKMII